jgi:signal transduction histidine kinase/DNA-binding LacI/PurR family transcriptional regulator/ActR/RegA family two-component response regulator
MAELQRSRPTEPHHRLITDPRPHARTFAILADGLADEYQTTLVGGIIEAAQEAGVNLLLIDGCVMRSPFRFDQQHTTVYDLARSKDVHGIVLQAGTISNYLGVEELTSYCERFRPLPIASLSAAIDGTTGIVVDGRPALQEGIQHLVEGHGRRRVAFLGGPEGNTEARERLSTYHEVMAIYGLRPTESLIVTGNFQYKAGADAVSILLDERGATFDAIVAANDLMALGAIDALRARDIGVPREVAVIGFDDISESRYSGPPLTTIRQPLRQQGRLAVDVLLRRLRGEQLADVLTIPAELVIRRSCGCYAGAIHGASPITVAQVPDRAGSAAAIDEALKARRSHTLEAMRWPVSGRSEGIPAGWAEKLLDSLLCELRGVPAAFTDTVGTLLKETTHPGATSLPWQAALSSLQHELMPCLAPDQTMASRADYLIDAARVLVGEAIEDTQAHHRLMLERRTRSLSDAAETLSGAFDLQSLGAALRESLPWLGIPSAFVVLHRDFDSNEARVAFAYDPRRDAATLESITDAKLESTLLPKGLLPADRSFVMIVEPLFFKFDPLGFALFEMGPKDAFTYDALRIRISGALKVSVLIEELRVRASQLRQAQKMETLGQLSGAIAHDFNNLLQAIHGYAELAASAAQGNEELLEDIEQIVRAASRATELTRQLLTFSQPTRPNARAVNVNECVKQTVPMMRHLLGPAIQLSTVLRPEAGNIQIDPAQLEQAIVNLCVNSRDAMPDGGSVTIETGMRFAAAPIPANGASSEADMWAPRPSTTQSLSFVSVSDTGSGIAPEVRPRIFEPFFTTKETGHGTGLGLSIVYGIVRSASGDIVVESEAGSGTRFSLLFPPSLDAQPNARSDVDPPLRGTETVLLVEDEHAIRKLAERVLANRGYTVLSAANSAEARALWESHGSKVDLLLSDVMMPGQSGVSFAEELAGTGKPPRILFISGHVPGGVGGPTFPVATRLLAKPFSVAALLEAVRETLDTPMTGGNGTADRTEPSTAEPSPGR